MLIIDTPHNAGRRAAALKAAGVETVVRYYNHRNSTVLPEKRLTRAEAEQLAGAGLKIAVTFQQRQNQVGDFDEDKGLAAGRAAYAYARDTIRQPAGSAIYFSVDFDASTAQLAKVLAFFTGVRKAFDELGSGDPAYAVGAYGSGRVLAKLRDEGLATFFWLALARGWAEFQSFRDSGDWHLLQTEETRVAGLDVDLNEANPDQAGFGEFALSLGPVLPLGEPHVVIARSGLRLRQGPGLEFGVTAVVPFGTTVHVLRRDRDWGLVDLQGDGRADGHLHLSFLRAL